MLTVGFVDIKPISSVEDKAGQIALDSVLDTMPQREPYKIALNNY